MNPSKPFKVSPDGDGWCVSMEHPQNTWDFVVVHRSPSQEDCQAISESLNGLYISHVTHLLTQVSHEVRIHSRFEE